MYAMMRAAILISCLLGLVWGSLAFVPSPPVARKRTVATFSLGAAASNDDNKDPNVNRRSLISLLGLGSAGSIVPPSPSQAAASTVVSGPTYEEALAVQNPTVPMADLPMIRLRLPGGGVGRDYIAIDLKVKNEGPFEFMIDSGLTTELITPHLEQALQLGNKGSKNVVTGLGAGGSTQGGQLVKLDSASLCCGNFPNQGQSELNLPPLYAVVTDFPQAHIDPNHNVEGMLGMEALDYFDSDFDFAAQRFRLWAPGTAAAQAKKAGLTEIPAAVLNESGLLGIRVRTTTESQPVIGIVDCGASFSAMNLKAAEILGLSTDAAAYKNEPAVQTLGVDGRPALMPTKMVQLTYAGNPTKGPDGSLQFSDTPANWKPWDPVRMGVYNLPIFSDLLSPDGGKTPFNGPAVLVGLDILAQRRFILETSKTRARRIYMSPK